MKNNPIPLLLVVFMTMISCNQGIGPAINFSSDIDSLKFKLDTCLANFSQRRAEWQHEIKQIDIQKTDTAWEFDVHLKDSLYWDEKVRDYETLNSRLANHVLDSQLVKMHLVNNGKVFYTGSSKGKLAIQTILRIRVKIDIGGNKIQKSALDFQFDHPIRMEQGGKIKTILKPLLLDMVTENDGLLVTNYKQRDSLYVDIPFVGISMNNHNDSAIFYSWANKIRDSVFQEYPVVIRLIDSSRIAVRSFWSNDIHYIVDTDL